MKKEKENLINNEAVHYTRLGHKMSNKIRQGLIDILAESENDGLHYSVIAKKLGVSERTIYRYLTADVWNEIRKLRAKFMSKTLARIDRAIFNKALNGDLAAAKIIYNRWDVSMQEEEAKTLQTLEEIEQELNALQKEIDCYEKQISPKNKKEES